MFGLLGVLSSMKYMVCPKGCQDLNEFSSSSPEDSKNNRAIIEVAIEDALEIVAGREATYPIIRELVERNQALLRSNGKDLSFELAALDTLVKFNNYKETLFRQ